MAPKRGRIIIFDFDGVLADTFDTFYPLIRASMKKAGITITPKQYRDLFMNNVHRGFGNIIKNKRRLNTFKEFRRANYDKYYYDKKSGAKLFSGAANFIKSISRKKFTLSVASSGKKQNIKKLLEKNKIDRSFGLILANSSHSKYEMIKKILNKYEARPQQTFFVTDTVGDIKTVKKIGLKTIAVTWGFHSKQLIQKARPDRIVTNFKNLVETIDKI